MWSTAHTLLCAYPAQRLPTHHLCVPPVRSSCTAAGLLPMRLHRSALYTAVACSLYAAVGLLPAPPPACSLRRCCLPVLCVLPPVCRCLLVLYALSPAAPWCAATGGLCAQLLIHIMYSLAPFYRVLSLRVPGIFFVVWFLLFVKGSCHAGYV